MSRLKAYMSASDYIDKLGGSCGNTSISCGDDEFTQLTKSRSAPHEHLSWYLPVHGPSMIDKMKSCAYVCQFSNDGSLFVAGFQESHFRIDNVDMGWKIQEDIHARSLRLTITDSSLSPDRHFLVYSSISPVDHIVNVGSATKESQLIFFYEDLDWK